MKLVLQITSVFDESFKMQIRNIPTLFWYMLYRVFHFGQQVHFVQQSMVALAISPNVTLITKRKTTDRMGKHWSSESL